jgi:hypothetical protein
VPAASGRGRRRGEGLQAMRDRYPWLERELPALWERWGARACGRGGRKWVAMTEQVVLTEDLTKFYGNHLALDKLNLEVRKGQVFGFLGPKRAGKNTSVTPTGQASPSMSIPGGQAELIDPRAREEAPWPAR